jgi:multicomponent Na+:H+ antiporter subunit G
MKDIAVIILTSIGSIAILFASIGIVRMPDFFLRLSVTVKASTLGVGLLLAAAATVFPEIFVTTKAIAIGFFLLLTGPVAAHMIGRASYLSGIALWKGTQIDELDGMYDDEHNLQSKKKED